MWRDWTLLNDGLELVAAADEFMTFVMGGRWVLHVDW